MDKGVCSVLLGLCFYLLAQQGTISLHKVSAEQVEKLLDLQTNETVSEVNETDENGDGNNYEELQMREPEHGWELDAKVLDPDSDIGHLAESFIIMVNGRALSAKGVDPKKSHIYNVEVDNYKLSYKQEVEQGIINGTAAYKRNFQRGIRTWPYGIVPYEISSIFSRSDQKVIEGAVNEINSKTCIKFQRRKRNHASSLGHTSYVKFICSRGCWAHVGRSRKGRQLISLQKPWCVKHVTVVHEMLHALGMRHEHSRRDRDRYIHIFWENIRSKARRGFRKYSTVDNNPYDAESVLHYGLFSCSKNRKRTMSLKDKRLNFLPNSAKGLTFYDVCDITTFYKCTAKCRYKPICQNGGFVGHKCRCRCPDVTAGPRCQSPVTNKGCGGIVDVSRRSRVITSPNYPRNYDTNAKCVWLVKARKGQRVNLVVKDLHLSCNTLRRCYHWLEVRYNLPGQTGPRICGNARAGSYRTTPEGLSHLMILIFDSGFCRSRRTSKGFKVTVSQIGSRGGRGGGGTGCRNKPCIHGWCTTTFNNGYRCTCRSGYYGKNCDKGPRLDGNLVCTFEDNSCFMENANNDDFDWTIISGRTPSRGTGPSRAHSGARYMYAEMSSPRRDNECAILESTYSLPTNRYCLRMFYHMYGATVKMLRVTYQAQGVSRTELWARMGNQGDRWHSALIEIPYSTTAKMCGMTSQQEMPTPSGQPDLTSLTLEIFIEAVRGRSWNSDIAIDNLQLKRGSCRAFINKSPPATVPSPIRRTTSVYTCNFEPTSSCFLVNDKDDQFDWTVQQGKTHTIGTGPTAAAEGTHYAYIETTSPRKLGDKAVLVSNVAFQSADHCLEFQYHMYGNDVSKLRVFAGSGPKQALLWEMTGNKGKQWSKAKISISATTNLLIRLEGSRGRGDHGDIAVDDVKLVPGLCNTN